MPETIDVSVRDECSIFLFEAETEAAENWIDENMPDDVMEFCGMLAVEHRFAEDILYGMFSAGLVVAINGKIIADMQPA